MKIDYQEPSKDLLMRIDIHEKYGSANIDVWTNELLKPQAGMNILDVGCGAGKLSFLFNEYTKGEAKITGGDFSEELLDKAREKNKKIGANIDFQFLDFNQPFNFPDNTFDLCTSAFAIYYASDLDFTFGEAHRVLRSPDAVSGNQADGFLSQVHCPRTSRCSTTLSRKQPTRPFRPCLVLRASKVISSTRSAKYLPKLNCINLRTTSPSPKLLHSLTTSAPHLAKTANCGLPCSTATTNMKL